VTDTYPIRDIKSAEAAAFFAVLDEAFNNNEDPAAAVERELVTFEFDRSAAAFDGDQVVGTSSAYSFALSVPGGTAATSGISNVGVLPAYRRRGIMSAMMGQLLADAAVRGEALAALFASESGIYQRFGFGCAAQSLRCTIQRGEGALIGLAAPGLPGPVQIRVVAPGSVQAELAAVYAAAVAARPGGPARDDRWWRNRLADPADLRAGASPLRCVIAEDADGPRGYALYSTVPNWGADGIAANELNVRELIAADPVAAAALWRDLLSRDLVSQVRTGHRPVDDPLLLLLADRRRARAVMGDNLWVRLVDVPAALRQRSYACPVDVVIEVTDPVLPANAGRWRLTAAGAGGRGADGTSGAGGIGGVVGADGTSGAVGAVRCERTDHAGEVAVTAAALGAAYLGGTRLGALAAAGQVAEFRPGALAELSAALSWDPAPWCPTVF
jgi:predicted acetyltransferase